MPEGGLGTFNLAMAEAKAKAAEFRFYWPRIFVGVDVYNSGTSEATLTVRCPELREVSFTIKPGELRRVRTGWRDPSSSIVFEVNKGEGLRFDNLAFLHE